MLYRILKWFFLSVSATYSKENYFSSFITSKDVAKSTVEIAKRVLTNSMASTMSFKGQSTKKPFYKLKEWEAMQGEITHDIFFI